MIVALVIALAITVGAYWCDMEGPVAIGMGLFAYCLMTSG
jgi:hypothetical protein